MAEHLRVALVKLIEENKHALPIIEQLRSFETLAVIRAGALLAFNGLIIACVFTILAEKTYNMPVIFFGCFGFSIVATFFSLAAILLQGSYSGLRSTNHFVKRWDAIIEARSVLINFSTLASLFSVVFTVLMFLEVMRQPLAR